MLVGLCGLACTSPVAGPRRPPPPRTSGGATTAPPLAADPSAPDALPALRSPADWTALAYRPAYQPTAHTEVVKFLIDLEDPSAAPPPAGALPGRLYFMNSARHELHFTFAETFLDPLLDHARFNVAQYRRPDRRFVLGSLVHYLDADVWAFEMVAGDTLDAERTARAFARVRAAVFFGDALRYRPLSPLHAAHAEALGERLPSLAPNALLEATRYQPLVPGVAYGVLRRVTGELDVAEVRPNDLLVTARVPGELPPVAGLVTSALQAPLAHVAILCRNRGTPDMALRGAIDDPRLIALEGRLVRLEVGPQEFRVEEATREEAEAHWAARRPAQAFAPEVDESVRALRPVCELRLDDVAFAGAKAAQLGEVCALESVETPGGFVVPFHHYRQHLRRHGVRSDIEAMLVDAAFRADRRARAERLTEVRARIEGTPVDPALVREVHGRIRGSGRRWIFRSSTNAEDLVGFNGAGLYRSVIVDPAAGPEAVADALREVWASVWLQRGFEEREWFRIDPEPVSMAVLVQPFVDDVIATGVAITANPYDALRPGVLVNVQAAGGSVTGAEGDEIPEQVLIYTWAEDLEFEVLSRSSRTEGAALMREADLRRVGGVLQRLHEELVPLYGAGANAVDAELLLTRDHRVVIVQARPIDVRWTEGQRG
ncbi:MAG TPA: PEP/pyruvate-binding domain-containing protein [Polyangiaceae bacterium LLY-WYZ-15_(1-7)]|nr:PEP/pyruvate-binding domain-containing protein [Polyangiaceae bacterium LLY-WYZ-15_(1-7)]HJL07636.1 PEP/pyruvate-binding domain-containing protein [Polyangiaceae bacterium LLY-WYZ-15_(1-7)]HJL37619.1 PEP/pyruvate-binding domain-containing protein [Polyangiaceae bacterium LLY-WYZ-15_(1-7)]